MKRLIPKKPSSTSFSITYGLFMVVSLPVIAFLVFLLLRHESACGEHTPTYLFFKEDARGMICQICLEATDRPAKLLVDIHNAGKRTFWGYMSTEANFAIRVDDKWFQWLGGSDVKGSRYDPGSEYQTSVDLTDRNWGSGYSLGNRGIELLPGNHSVQVAFLLHESHSWRCNWIASNILHLSIAGK